MKKPKIKRHIAIRIMRSTARMLKSLRKTSKESYNDIIRRFIDEECKVKHFEKKAVKDEWVDPNDLRNLVASSLDSDDHVGEDGEDLS